MLPNNDCSEAFESSFFLCKMMIKIEYILEKKKNIKNMLVKAAELGKKVFSDFVNHCFKAFLS